VALAAVQRVDDVLVDVEEDDRLARLGEDLRQRDADIARPHDSNIDAHPAAKATAVVSQ
jgi:hypothetical protein